MSQKNIKDIDIVMSEDEIKKFLTVDCPTISPSPGLTDEEYEELRDKETVEEKRCRIKKTLCFECGKFYLKVTGEDDTHINALCENCGTSFSFLKNETGVIY